MNGIPDLEELRQEHENFLAELEGLAVQAIASNNWDTFYQHLIDFQNLTVRLLKLEASTDSLSGSGADLFSQTANNTIKD